MAKREREGLVGNANRAEEADAGGRVPELSGAEDREPTIKERVEAITGVRSLREARGRVVPSLVFVRLAVLVGLPGEDWGLERLQAGPKSKTSTWREFFEDGLYLGELPGEGGDGGRWTIGRGSDGVAWLAKIAPKMTLTPGEEVEAIISDSLGALKIAWAESAAGDSLEKMGGRAARARVLLEGDRIASAAEPGPEKGPAARRRL